MPDDRVKQFQLGDPRAFEQLYEQWSLPVYRYLLHLTGMQALAEDLYQDTWAKALDCRQQLRNSDLFGPWIFRIARNLAFNEMRKGRRKGQVWSVSELETEEQAEGGDLLERVPNQAPNPLEQTIDAQRRQIVERIMTELDPATREMLQLRYFEQFSLAEIAEVLEVPLGTVCTKIHRGLKAIQVRLKVRGIHALEEI